MKRIFVSLAVIVSVVGMLASSAFAQGVAAVAPRPGDVVIDKITPSMQNTPQYELVGGDMHRFRVKQWFEIEVEFTTRPAAISELTARYFVLFNGRLLAGDVTHVEIAKGSDHVSVAYVSPKTMETLTAGKPLVPTMIENVWVQLVYEGQVLASKSFKGNVPLPNLQQMNGLILNKLDTPFAPLYWDRYEEIKPSAPAH